MGLPNFISDQQLTQAVKSALGVMPSEDISPEWASIISNANNSATGDIYERLAMQGFLPSQIANWDQGEQYATDLGTFWALTRGSGLGNYPANKLENLDRREELSTKVSLIIEGTPTASAPQSDVGGITHGTTAGSNTAALEFQRFDQGCCAIRPRVRCC